MHYKSKCEKYNLLFIEDEIVYILETDFPNFLHTTRLSLKVLENRGIVSHEGYLSYRCNNLV